MSAIPRFPAVLRAQTQIWMRSPLVVVPFGAAGYSLLVAGLQFATAEPTWADSLAHLNMWVVMIGPLFTAVLAGALAMVDKRSRSGGVEYRAVTRSMLRNARFVIIAVWCLLAHSATLTVSGALGLVSTTAAPLQIVGDSIGLLAVLWISYLGYCALLTLVGELAGIGGCVAVGLLFSVLGTVSAESSLWYLAPPAWIVRPALPLIGTHANGVGLDGAQIDHGPAAAVLGAVSAVAFLLAAPAISGTVQRLRNWAPSAPPARSRVRYGTPGRRYGSPTAAVFAILRSWWVGVMAVGAVGATVLLQWWYSPSVAYLFFALIVLPMGCAVLPAIWIPRIQEGFRAVAVRPRDPRTLATRVALFLLATEALVCVIVGVTAVLAKESVSGALRQVMVSAVVGAMLVMLSALITAVGGRIAGLLAGFVGVLFGTLVGGTGLADLVGLAVPWSWAAYLEASRMIFTIPLACAAAALMYRIFARRMTRV
ncbi:hypothetical protein [Nocardia sp. NPDC019395]|uniref:hypothetical protein n=1 Tax=Nocardia sp. NPDC019395 TaxID=3154686 RepID=UPI0033F15E5E